jgi:hypothetical protein
MKKENSSKIFGFWFGVFSLFANLEAFLMETPGTFFLISNFLLFPCLSSSFFIYVFAVTQSLYAEVKNMKIYVLMTRQEQEECGKCVEEF